jgi:hypothetical protein
LYGRPSKDRVEVGYWKNRFARLLGQLSLRTYSTENASNRFPPEAPLVIAYPELTKSIPPEITGPDTEIAPP